MSTKIYKFWKKILPILYIVILIHLLKDITQDILKIHTFLDLMGDAKEDISSFPLVVQNIFSLLGYGSFVVEIALLISIPIIFKRKQLTTLEIIVIMMILFLIGFFVTAILLDPRFRL